MLIALYILGAFIAALVAAIWTGKVKWNEETSDRLAERLEHIADRLQEPQYLLVVTISVPIITAFFAPILGGILFLVSIVAFIAWARR